MLLSRLCVGCLSTEQNQIIKNFLLFRNQEFKPAQEKNIATLCWDRLEFALSWFLHFNNFYPSPGFDTDSLVVSNNYAGQLLMKAILPVSKDVRNWNKGAEPEGSKMFSHSLKTAATNEKSCSNSVLCTNFWCGLLKLWAIRSRSEWISKVFTLEAEYFYQSASGSSVKTENNRWAGATWFNHAVTPCLERTQVTLETMSMRDGWFQFQMVYDWLDSIYVRDERLHENLELWTQWWRLWLYNQLQ